MYFDSTMPPCVERDHYLRGWTWADNPLPVRAYKRASGLGGPGTSTRQQAIEPSKVGRLVSASGGKPLVRTGEVVPLPVPSAPILKPKIREKVKCVRLHFYKLLCHCL